MTAAHWAAVVVIVVFYLVVLAICSDSKRREDHAPVNRPNVIVLGDDPAEADAMKVAVEELLASGGRVEDVLQFRSEVHPSGAVHVTLVLAGDAVDEAERVLRRGGGR